MEAIVILAGGAGTRLWPASTKERPKQFLSLGLDRSFLQTTVERALEVNPGAELLVVTHRDYAEGTVEQLREYADRGTRIAVLPEPVARNTAPAVAFAAEYLKGRLGREARMLVLSADHLIRPTEKFVADVRKADEFGERGMIAVFGIPPSEPNTGYGYIEAGEALSPGFRVRGFKEKPDAATAAAYLESGRYYWNSGMFLFSLAAIDEEFADLSPEVTRPFTELRAEERAEIDRAARNENGILVWGDCPVVERLYGGLPSISIDYAVMEKSRRVAMVKACFEWNDVGSWDEVARLLPGESPLVISESSSRNAVYSDIPVALCGVDDLVVVILDGKALILKKGSSQLVKSVATRFLEGREKPR